MTITRVGSTQKYADGWDTAFGRSKKSAGKPSGSGASKAKKKAPAKKKSATGKKSARKKSR